MPVVQGIHHSELSLTAVPFSRHRSVSPAADDRVDRCIIHKGFSHISSRSLSSDQVLQSVRSQSQSEHLPPAVHPATRIDQKEEERRSIHRHRSMEQTGRLVRMEREYKPREPLHYYGRLSESEERRVRRFHTSESHENQTQGFIYKEIEAPTECVWQFVRRFDKPQAYKEFLMGCEVVRGDGRRPGSVRHVTLKPELPGKDSIEQLELLDDDNRVFSFRILSGQHELHGYKSVTSVADRTLTTGRPGSLVIESYVVDVPEGSTEEQTNTLVHTLVRTHLINLEKVARCLNEDISTSFSCKEVTGAAASTNQ